MTIESTEAKAGHRYSFGEVGGFVEGPEFPIGIMKHGVVIGRTLFFVCLSGGNSKKERDKKEAKIGFATLGVGQEEIREEDLVIKYMNYFARYALVSFSDRQTVFLRARKETVSGMGVGKFFRIDSQEGVLPADSAGISFVRRELGKVVK
jgi:hypothetical protein